MNLYLEFKNYGKDSAILINKNAIMSVSTHHNLKATVIRVLYNNEFLVAESVEEVIAKMKGENNE
jgi:hypothetical protein